MAAVKAKEKEMKDEKEAERQVSDVPPFLEHDEIVGTDNCRRGEFKL